MEGGAFHSYCMEKRKMGPNNLIFHTTLPFVIPCTSAHVIQYHHANSRVPLAGGGIRGTVHWTVGAHYHGFLATACAVQATSQSSAIPQLLPRPSVK